MYKILSLTGESASILGFLKISEKIGLLLMNWQGLKLMGGCLKKWWVSILEIIMLPIV